MTSTERRTGAAVYNNPVYGREFPDPFVLKYCSEYWAYCTGVWTDGRCFGILKSVDLINWQEVGGAMAKLPGDATCYWAPEVVYHNGFFYLYYSVGNEETMEIRVAVARHPAGPFEARGRKLTSEPFAIDAHVFIDEDGQNYLFYATDFLQHSRVGTGTVRDLMLDPFTLAGQPQPVTRALYDWQVYDPHRVSKGGVRWHTIEGSFVLKRKGLYYQMFSGGNWQNISYGVSYAITDDLTKPGEWSQVADGEKVFPILRTIPGKVIGPGHNSVVQGPDNRQLYCIYHRWSEDGGARLLSLDRQEWVGERMMVLGPSVSLQPAPVPASLRGFFGTSGHWTFEGGNWIPGENELVQAANGAAGAILELDSPSFLTELSLRSDFPAVKGRSYGLALYNGKTPLWTFLIEPGRKEVAINGPEERLLPLPEPFDPAVFHLVRLEVDERQVKIRLDNIAWAWRGRLEAPSDRLGLLSRDNPATFSGFELTYGWADLFEEVGDPAFWGWNIPEGQPGWEITGKELVGFAISGSTVASKGPLYEAYELVVNVRFEDRPSNEGGYGFYPAWRPTDPGPLFRLVRKEQGYALAHTASGNEEVISLPASFNPAQYQQFRFTKRKDHLAVQWEALPLGELACPSEPATVGLFVEGGQAAYDMVRVTALPCS